MKKIAVLALTLVGLTVGASQAHAGWGSQLHYSGYQPWWNIFAKRYKCLTPEEERLQKFWHDYYNALKNYYCALDNIDWVAYYKNHGYQINGGCYGGGGGCGRINYAPVFVSPTMQWAVPNGCISGPTMPPMGMPPMGGMPMGGGYPGGLGMMPGPGMVPGGH